MSELTDDLLQAFSYLTKRASRDWPAFDCPPEHLIEFLQALRQEYGYDFLTDVTAIDWYEESPRFVVVYHLFSTQQARYIRVATPCLDDNEPSVPTVSGIWPTADWHERETYDMFGIQFEGHPDLRRILMWEEYPYFPLRKEFPLAGHEVDLPAEDIAERTGVKAQPAPMMGGPFHSGQTGPMSRREPRADDESWTEVKRRPEELDSFDQPREFRESARREQ
ncbi:MAG: NADH-quinone oxidoreductase subunit C [Puniceicoccaceae bacterium 5H]|nr:MAG: NADH-quinone oxidoreductase subunit C [Puniceicoccaceae bacterium 5H]